MTRSDPAYAYFVEDARRKGYLATCDNPDHKRPRQSCPNCKLLADYFRDYGIVPPVNYGRPTYKDREITVGDNFDRIEHPPKRVIDKSWGEPGRTVWV